MKTAALVLPSGGRLEMGAALAFRCARPETRRAQVKRLAVRGCGLQ